MAENLRSNYAPGYSQSYQDEQSTTNSFQPYPLHRPFINNDYTASPSRSSPSAMPVSERSGVMSALKNLQSKIRSLESERSMAEANLEKLASETDGYKDALHKEQSHSRSSQSHLTKQTQELENHLNSAETRCHLLEKQLDYMRKMVHNAEDERTQALRRPESSPPRRPMEDYELKHQFDKISELEREHLKLTATQTLAESKIRDLEEKLKEERHHRRVIQERTAGLQTQAETNRILLDTVSPPRPRSGRSLSPRREKKTKKKKRPVSARPTSANTRRAQPADHYHLNIPFVAGTSTAPSHAVGANFQQLLHMMKAHNPKLCQPGANGTCPYKHGTRNMYDRMPRRRESSSSVGSSSSDLNDLLTQLQDEFGHMSFEHQELIKEIDEASDPRLRDDLERELDHLVTRMEAKGAQIRKVRNCKEKFKEKKHVKKKTRIVPQRQVVSRMDPHEYPSSSTNEVEVTTTVRTKGKGARAILVANPSRRDGPSRNEQLNLLKDVKKVQSTLRKDDISWD